MRGEPSDLANLVVDACHDLRTPLAAAFGFARTIERMGGVTGDNAMYLQQVVEATQELEQLIAALSAVAHGERGTLRLRPQPVDLAELALEASEGSGHALERDVTRRHDRDRSRARRHLAGVAGGAVRGGAGDRAGAPVADRRGRHGHVRARSPGSTRSSSSAICAPMRGGACSACSRPRSSSRANA